MTRAFLLLLACLLANAHPATAQSKRAPVELHLNGTEAPEAVEKMMNSAQKSGAPVIIRMDTTTPKAADALVEPPGLFDLTVQGTTAGLRALPAVATIPRTLGEHTEKYAHEFGGSPFLKAFLIFLAAAAGGVLAAWIGRRILNDRSAERPQPMSLWPRAVEALRRGLADAVGIIAFNRIAVGLAAVYIAPELPIMAGLINLVTLHTTQLLWYLLLVWAMLKPFANGERLIPMPNADHNTRLMVIYSFIGPVMSLSIGLLQWIGASTAQISGWFMLGSTLVLAYKVWFFMHIRHDIAALIQSGAPNGQPPGRIRNTYAALMGPVLAGSMVAIWLAGRIATVTPTGAAWSHATAATQFYLILTPFFAYGASRLVRDWFNAHKGEGETTPMHSALKETAGATAGAALWVVAILDLGRLWSHFLNTVLGDTGVNILRGFVGAAATAIAGILIWMFLRKLLEGYLPKPQSLLHTEDDADGAQPTIQSRLSSVMPVVRGLLLSLVIAITALLILTRLGIDTGPLLAGFGIAGLALSFGSQALVRDVVSGIFFLADDAFRVGEYIDTGKLKGTVEHLSLRSVRLRHQSGLVHTIPYGQLQGVTNASRDWATIKFTIRLDRDADIEKARKVIKKVGADLMSHEEFGGDFIMPVKMQGITDIQDNALVVRIKFTAKPFRTSQIQREALKRIYLGLTQAGVALATTEVRVRGDGKPDATAAAHSAVTQAQAAALPAPG